ncbi:hypothetical protein F9278_29680 [Streptomyces phaeolivaceus]|uniref:Uncharacterized protein n=1 Tax=Streptomyces phaeolivaceus TaxID=2653200 RepID=A0A5P8K8I3_9ACTN|nr:hypothetical protein [Streptomyces phaeolivaceus]QFQ99633.1 hypothetical protein F9278_29680 [Streptomyces phaeolivaceus]
MQPVHDDVAYKEQEVQPPPDIDSRTDAAGHLVFTGTCPVCHGWNEYTLVDVRPGTIPKGLPWRRKATGQDLERQMDCSCPITHPGNDDEFSGCGAWWPVLIPAQGTS